MRTSVVIPTFRRPEMAKRAVKSAFQQTVSPDEVLLVCADPKEREHLVGIRNQFPSLIVLSADRCLNGAAARNFGVKNSSGEIVLFLDDDDYWAECFIEMHVKKLRENQATMGYSGIITCFEGGARIYSKKAPRLPKDVCSAMTKCLFSVTTTSSLSIRRKSFVSLGGFDEGLGSFEDWDLFYRTAKHGFKIVRIPMPMTYYSQHGGARLSSSGPKREIARNNLLQKWKGDKAVKRFIQTEAVYSNIRDVVHSAMPNHHKVAKLLALGLENHDIVFRRYYVSALLKASMGIL